MTTDETIAEGDRVMVSWTFHGTHQGELSGLPPTNRQVTYSGINTFCIADGKGGEIRDIFDRLWMWQQLGVFPETKEATAKAGEQYCDNKVARHSRHSRANALTKREPDGCRRHGR